MKTASILLSVALLFTACSTTSTPENTATCSIDYEARELIREWNNLSAQLLASYMDMAIPVDQVINDLGSLNPQLKRVVRENEDLTKHADRQERKLFKLNSNLKKQTKELDERREVLEKLSSQLAKYIPPQIHNAIF